MEIASHLPLILTVIVLLILSAFFSGAETAFFSLSNATVSEMGNGSRRKRQVKKLLDNPRMLLVMLLFGNLVVNIANTSAVTALGISIFGEKGIGYAMILMTFLILVFGEIAPKSFAMKHAPVIAPMVAPILRMFMVLFAPVRSILGMIADMAVLATSRIFGENKEGYASRELATAVEIGHGEGLFDEFEKRILTNLFEFTETTVREILTPRVDVFTLDVETEWQDALIAVRNHGFTRVPLYRETTESIIGILHARDLLGFERGDKAILETIMRPAKYVPESKKIRDLLHELISDREHVAIALDEHGAFEGIVSLEDILEEIFGEIRNRHEPLTEDFNLIDKDHIIVDGAMKLEDLNEYFGTDLDSEEVETVGGYIIELMGKIPREGESFEIYDLRYLVLSAEVTRINKMKIEKIDLKGDLHEPG